MSAISLEAKNQTEQRILDYLVENASEVLAEKINAGKKTLSGAVNYATSEARNLAKGASALCVDDVTVFGWIVHYFEEDEIKESAKAPKSVKVPAKVAKKEAVNSKKKPEPCKPRGPMVLDLFTGMEVSVL
jgi:hypothetical protein